MFLYKRMTSSTADKYTTTEYGKQNRFAVNPLFLGLMKQTKIMTTGK